MSLKYFARYRFNNPLDPGEEDFGERDLAVETGSAATAADATHGEALSLSGTSLLAAGDFSHISGDNDRAISFWANTSGSPGPVLSYGSLAGPDGFSFYTRNSAGVPEFYNHTTRYAASTGNDLNTWHFFALVYSATALALDTYVDGSLLFSAGVGQLSTGSSEALRIGTDGSGNFFSGSVLDLRMWDTTVSPSVVSYLFQNGPNYEEPLDSNYVQNSLRTESIVGGLVCRANYGVKASGEVLYDSFYGHDSSADVHEAARTEYSQNSSGKGVATMMVRHTPATGTGVELAETLEVTPETTTFSSREPTDDSTSSVVFSSEGVRLVPSSASSEKGCLIFGKGADFRIRVKDGLFVVEAYNSTTDSYTTKMEIGS